MQRVKTITKGFIIFEAALASAVVWSILLIVFVFTNCGSLQCDEKSGVFLAAYSIKPLKSAASSFSALLIIVSAAMLLSAFTRFGISRRFGQLISLVILVFELSIVMLLMSRSQFVLEDISIFMRENTSTASFQVIVFFTVLFSVPIFLLGQLVLTFCSTLATLIKKNRETKNG